MTLSIIIPNLNTKKYLDKCLESIFLHTRDLEFEIIVIDDCSSDGSPDMLIQKYPQVALIENRRNLGFTKTTNSGIRKSKGKYILLLNSDTHIDSNTFKTMVSFMEKHPEVGAVGPRIFNPDGSEQIVSMRNFPTLMSEIFEGSILGMLFPRIWFTRKYKLIGADRNKSQMCESLSGACLMIRQKVICETGLLEEKYPRSFDDLDICFRIRRAGWGIYYFPQARIVHYGGVSFEQRIDESDINSQTAEIIFFRKFFPKWHVSALKMFRFMDTVFKILITTFFSIADFASTEPVLRKMKRNIKILMVIVEG